EVASLPGLAVFKRSVNPGSLPPEISQPRSEGDFGTPPRQGRLVLDGPGVGDLHPHLRPVPENGARLYPPILEIGQQESSPHLNDQPVDRNVEDSPVANLAFELPVDL